MKKMRINSIEHDGKFIRLNGTRLLPNEAHALGIALIESAHESVGGRIPRVIEDNNIRFLSRKH